MTVLNTTLVSSTLLHRNTYHSTRCKQLSKYFKYFVLNNEHREMQSWTRRTPVKKGVILFYIHATNSHSLNISMISLIEVTTSSHSTVRFAFLKKTSFYLSRALRLAHYGRINSTPACESRKQDIFRVQQARGTASLSPLVLKVIEIRDIPCT